MTRIYLIRHTQAEGNQYRMMQGQWDGAVTPMGERQIEALSKRFEAVPVDAVYSSDLSRAILTAEGIAKPKGLSVKRDARLRELDLGMWESQFFGNVRAAYPEDTRNFLFAPEQWHVDGAETMEEVADRAIRALEEIAGGHEEQTVVVVSHGITIRCVLSKILGKRMAGEELLPIFKNTAVTELCCENGSFTVMTMGDASHIEALPVSDWVTLDALRDENFDPASDPSFYTNCYEEAWQTAHCGNKKHFRAEPFYQAARQHYSLCPDAVKKFYSEEACAGLIDCDVERGKHAGYGWISFLYLVPELRGKGYGAQVLGRAIALYSRLGRRVIRLHAAASNERALRFYRKCGFEILSSEAGSDGPLYLMEKKIGGGVFVR